MQNIKNKAFTLIELLVVVAIISLLSSVVIVSLQDSREKAAFAKLREQTRHIQTALELYRNENGGYPEIDSADIPSLISELDRYIEPVALDTTQIRSFEIDDIGYINNDTIADSFKLLCNDSLPPYLIYMYTPGKNLSDTLAQLRHVGGSDEVDYYCLSTSI